MPLAEERQPAQREAVRDRRRLRRDPSEAVEVRRAVRHDEVAPGAHQQALHDLLVHDSDVTADHERTAGQVGGGEQVQHGLAASAGQSDDQHLRRVGGDRGHQSGRRDRTEQSGSIPASTS